MNSNQLRRLFARALSASLASPLVLTGCGDGGISLEGFSAPPCDNGRVSLQGLAPATPTDFIELRIVTDLESSPRQQRLASVGTACETATQPAVCNAELDALASEDGFRSRCDVGCYAYYLVTTRGDSVEAHTSRNALAALLGSIDTPTEALLQVFAEDYNVSCTELKHGAVKTNADGTFSVIATKGFACGEGTELTQYLLVVKSSGEVVEKRTHVLERGDKGCSVGRRPAGLRSDGTVDCVDELGQHFALITHLEEASITAFLRLREELALHGAAVELQQAALRSALDEVAHTQVCGSLARRHGVTPERAVVAPLAPRPLFEVALDNAVEGCVRETYGALLAHHQALHAEDAEVREAMVRIAEDETRHADLSWAVDRWAEEKLSPEERETVRAARQRAVEALRAEVSSPTDEAVLRALGLPQPEVALAMVEVLSRELWN
ncbi:ferritin-like domain-containing protein [Myxococcus sp. AS-1-15]|uniref:ferritin-like domain-containing protein n=1 Tax=Myxococcus sp. AS-1-15 TaxID=2874600 RepID=UPI001CBC4DAC|nr:ferritin-like domain-containing protein [Myxococcus sp. AS-1-15]MBZ4398986.1 ferritin-like domain-containing protein [Myxococcus sp. AS-1-15]